ncbi:hypothetical protein BH09VER1_BH09VER1_45280 [soil metagenome]
MLSRIFTIAYNTFTELVRQKVFYILLVFAIATICFSFFFSRVVIFAQEFEMLKSFCLGAMSFFTILLAILATANFLPKDLEDRTIYTLLAKPVPRFAYLFGRLAGMIAMLFFFILIMSAVFSAVLWVRQNSIIADIHSQGGSPEEVAGAIKQVTDATFNANLIPGILIIFINAAVLASMTLLVSTFSSSMLFTVMISAAMYVIGLMQATAREVWTEGVTIKWYVTVLTGLIALIFPDMQAFNLGDDVIAGAALPWNVFFATFGLGWLYVAVYAAVAAFVFSGREL